MKFTIPSDFQKMIDVKLFDKFEKQNKSIDNKERSLESLKLIKEPYNFRYK